MNSVPIAESSITIDAPTNDVQRSSIGLFIFGPLERTMAYLRNLWTNYYPPRAFGEDEPPLMLGSALNFTVGGLIGLVEVKSQGNTGFPFQTNPRTMKVSINSLIMYAIASAAEHVLSLGRPAPTSVYAIVARLGRMVSLVILIGSLASLFYL